MSQSPSSTSTGLGWLREPLLQFLLIGGAVFGVDHFVNGAADDHRSIVVDAAVAAVRTMTKKYVVKHEATTP